MSQSGDFAMQRVGLGGHLEDNFDTGSYDFVSHHVR